jgi:hypothetical protein
MAPKWSLLRSNNGNLKTRFLASLVKFQDRSPSSRMAMKSWCWVVAFAKTWSTVGSSHCPTHLTFLAFLSDLSFLVFLAFLCASHLCHLIYLYTTYFITRLCKIPQVIIYYLVLFSNSHVLERIWFQIYFLMIYQVLASLIHPFILQVQLALCCQRTLCVDIHAPSNSV